MWALCISLISLHILSPSWQISFPAECSSTNQCRRWFPPPASPLSLPNATWASPKPCESITLHTHTRLFMWRCVICVYIYDFSLCPLYRYTLEQQIIAPSFSMQQVNCNAVLVPSPVFTSPIMIPHNSFITNQSQSAYHAQPQASQHSLQPQQFFQVRCPWSDAVILVSVYK